ncbi:MAG: VWA domain-containing protein [Planctomycetaceae bacterium]
MIPYRFARRCAAPQRLIAILLGIFTLGSSQTLIAQDSPSPGQGAPSASAAALRSIFNPSRAPEQKTMGLLQRSFLDLAEQEGSLLQMAIVVDGTDSMTTELSGVRESITAMIKDLRRCRSGDVEVALVIYRDHGSPSGEVTIPLVSFSRDTDAIAAAIEKITPESGAPFFHELVDVGLHRTLSELPWSSDPSTSRWIMLFGDAPPYEESFTDSQHPTARRRYATELLVALAARKSIRINCVLCTSDNDVKEPYDKAIDQTRTFMNSLASGTDGLMLDLSYPDIRTAIIEANNKPDAQYIAIDPITRSDLNTMSVSMQPAQAAPDSQPKPDPAIAVQTSSAPGTTIATGLAAGSKDVRIAVLPHLPLDRMSFDPGDPAVQVSTALRNNFAAVPGVRVVSPIDIQNQLRRLRADNVSDDQRLRALAARLGVDYVIWGSLEPTGPTVQSAAYRRTDGNRVVQVSLSGDQGSLTRVLLSAASTAPTEKDGALGGLMKRIEQSVAASALDQLLASTPVTRKEVLAAMEALEQAMGLPAGSEESLARLQRASTSIAAATAAEPRNPLVQWLAANTSYNLASYHYGKGDLSAGEKQMKEMGRTLSRAYRGRADIKLPSLATEVQADYLLLVSRDVKAAIAAYESMTNPDQPSATQRRGHWMLSGIYAGDWGVDESNVNPALARQHLVAILSHWQESPEAELLRKWMRWDDTVGKTKFSYLPIVNNQLAKVVPPDDGQ